MIPVPVPPDFSDEDAIESETAVWGFLLALFIFKIVTVVVIFWQLRTWESGLVLGATLWYWFPPFLLLAAGPVIFYLRLRKVRARREALRRSEWMLDDGLRLPAMERPGRS